MSHKTEAKTPVSFGKLLSIVLLVALTFSIGWMIKNWHHFERFPSILPAYYAKEYCTCYYVMELDKEYCRGFAKQYIAIEDHRIDEKAKKITVDSSIVGADRQRSASYLGPKAGCRLEPYSQ